MPTTYVASVVAGLGELAAERGDSRSATRLLQTAAEMARSVGDPWATARALLGSVPLLRASEPAGADDLLREALALHLGSGARLGVAEALEVAAWVAADAGDPRRVAKLLATADGLRDALGAVRPPWVLQRCEQAARAARDRLGGAGYAAAAAEGDAEGWEQVARTVVDPTR